MKTRQLVFRLLAALIVTAAPALAQKDPTAELGFHPERLYHFTDVDNVNANNGNLLVALPVGLSYTLSPTLSYQFNLVYNSKVWDYETWEDDGVTYREVRPGWRSNAGLGWIVSLGRLIPPYDPSALPPPYKTGPGVLTWTYEGPSGDEHPLSEPLTVSGGGGVAAAVVGDQVPLRLIHESPTSTTYKVQSIDGVTRTFDCVFGRCYLQEISDSFGNWVKIDTTDLSHWIVTDSADRTHTVDFQYFAEMADGVSRGFHVDSITEEGFAKTPITYQFTYAPTLVPGGCGGDRAAPGSPPGGPLHLLTSVHLPDGSPAGTTFDFTYYDADYYEQNTNRYSKCEQGSLRTLRFPTGGTIKYEYGPYDFASGDVCAQAPGLATGTVGIRKRTITDGTRNPDGSLKQRVWDYIQLLGPQAPATFPPDPCHNGSPPQGPYYWTRTSIVSPVGEDGKRTRTDNYFDAWVPAGQPLDPFVSEAEHFGLVYDGSFAMPSPANARKIKDISGPDIAAIDSDHRGITSQTYGGCDSAGDCTNGILLRSVYKNWQTGSRPLGRDKDGHLIHQDIRWPQSIRTLFHDDVDSSGNASCGGTCYIDSSSSDFDKISHFRTQTTSSNFPGATAVVSKTKYRLWIDDEIIAVPRHWIAATYSERSVTENAQTALEQFCFDDASGFLLRHRLLAGAAPGAHDVLNVFAPSADGYPALAFTYGGDKQDVGTDASLCTTTLPSSFWYKVENTYDAGIVRTSRSYDRDTQQPFPFLSINRTIDHSSGAVKAVTDSAGVTTAYGYEAISGRLQTMTLPGGAVSSYAYRNAAGTAGDPTFSPPAVDAVTASTTGRSTRNVVFDGLGQPIFDSHTGADGAWIATATTYDALGRIRSTSTPQSLTAPATLGFIGSYKTLYLYDALGRGVQVQQPDGATAITHYTGQRVVARSTSVAMAGGEVPSWTTEIYDAQHRLMKVVEGQLAENAAGVLTADYRYDAAGRLISVESYGSGAPVQRRSFNYDGRGFLLSESHPEKGANGNGTTDYGDYDPKGHAGRKDERGTRLFSLKYTYDSLARLSRIDSVDPAAYDPARPLQWRIFKRFDFDADVPATSSVNGRLVRATRHNYLNAFSSPRDVVVSEHYSYGAAGMVSERKTCTASFAIDSGGSVPEVCDHTLSSNIVFASTFSHDDLGDQVTAQMPVCDRCVMNAPAPSRFSANTFADGWLKEIGTRRLESGATDPLARIQFGPTGAVSSVEHLTTTGGVTLDTMTPDAAGLARPAAITFDGWTSCALPIINSNPSDALVPMGTKASLTVTVTSDEPPTYQWFTANGPIPNATDWQFQTDPVYTVAFYWVEVTNSCGTVRSQQARVSPDCFDFAILSQPPDTTVVDGQAAQLAVGTSGDVREYKWFEGTSGDIAKPAPLPAGSTTYTAQYVTPAIAAGQTRRFWVQITGTYCGVQSAPKNSDTATVSATTCVPATITQQPPSSIESAGGVTVQLSIGVSGNQPRVEWHDASDDSVVANGLLLSVHPTKTTTYFARVYWTPCPINDPNSQPQPDHIDSIHSTVHVTSCSLVTMTAQPSDQLVEEGHSATISMAASLKEVDAYLQGISVVWYQGSSGDTAQPVQIVNAFSSQALSFTTPILQNDTHFWARIAIGPKSVSDACPISSIDPKCTGCSVDTRTVTVVVCHPPVILKQPQNAVTTPGNPAKLSIDVKGTGLRYQWYYGAAGDTSHAVSPFPTYGGQAEIPIQLDNTSLWVRILGACGQADSIAVNVRLCYPPAITLQPPADLPILTGQTPTISVDSDQADATYQWWEGDAGVGTPVATGKNFTLPVLPGETTHTYFGRATGNLGCHTDSRTVNVTVCTPPSILSWLTEIYSPRGANVDIRITASSDANIYTWYRGVTGDTSHIEAGPNSSATLSRAALETTSYWVRVSNGRCTTDSPTTTVYVCKPDIVTQPATQTILAGTSATLSVAAAGTEPFSYQWYEGASGDTADLIAGQTGPSLTVSPSQDTSYWVSITSPCPTTAPAQSAAAVVHVCVPPVITASPASRTVCLGSAANLSVTATGTAPVHYQWWIGAPGDTTQPIGGSDSATIAVSPTQTTTYWVQVTAGCTPTGSSAAPTANSAAATLTINVPPTVTGPADKTVVQGSTAQFSVSADQTSTFEWYRGVAGDTGNHVGSGAAYTTPALSQTTQYWVRANNGQCTTDSRTATVSVCVPPAIAQWTGDMTSARGATVALRAVAGADATSYTLYLGVAPDTSLPINGNTTGSFNVAPLQTTSYWVRVSNGTCSSDTTTSAVYICTPDITAQPAASQTITAGNSAMLSVAAAGTTPLSYQWYQGASGDTSHPLANQTGQSITVSPAQDTSYWVAVSSPCPTPAPARSATAIVHVCSPPNITASPSSQTVCLGTSATLSVSATGSTVLHYQWYIGASGNTSQPIGSTDSATITVSPTQTTTYWVQVTGPCAPVANSAAATLTVNVPPTVTGPADQTVVQGHTAVLSASANQTSTFEWYQGVAGNTANHVGSGATYTTPALAQTTQYWARASNGQCTADSRTATMNVCVPPAISQWSGSMVSPRGGTVTLSVSASPDATTYTLYRGTSGDTTQVQTGPQSSPSFNVAPLQTTSYWMRVSNGTCSSDTTTTTISICTPDITAQPTASQTIASGTSTTLSVTAAGTTPFSYQWYQGASGDTTHPLTGSTGQSVSVSPTANTSYWVAVSSPCTPPAPARSNTAVVNVCTPASITTQPASTVLRLGSSTTLTVAANGSNRHYQWWIGPSGSTTQPIGSSDSASITVAPSQTTSYWVSVTATKAVASDPCGSTVNSAAATVTVCVPPAVTGPNDAIAVINQSAQLSVSCNQSCTFQWYQGAASNTAAPVGTGSTFNTPNLTQATQYWVRASNGQCSTDSRTATVSVCTPPSISQQPADVTTTSGQLVYLSVTASSDATTYTWYQGTAPDTSLAIVGPGNYPTIGIAPQATTSYWVRISNGSCSVNSGTATVRVCAPAITQQPQNVSIISGSTTTLSVAANGTPPLSYQWYIGSSGTTTQPTGTSSASLNVNPTTTKSYWVNVATSCGSVNSSTATVTVSPCTTVAINSTSSYYDGAAWQLSAWVTGTAVQAEWYKSDPPGSPYVRFATTANASLVPQSSTVYVYVHAYNPCSERIQYLSLTIPSGGAAPMMVSDPSSATYSGDTATPLRVKAHGQNLSYQWFGSDPDGSPYAPIAGEHSPELTILPRSPVASFYAVVMNEAGLVQSAAATLRRVSCAAPAIARQPASEDDAGSGVLLSVDAAGDAPLAYQWYASDPRGGSWKPVDGATSNALRVVSDPPAYYFVRVANACGTADSYYVGVAASDGCAAPSIASQPQSADMQQQSGAALAVGAAGTGLDYQWFRSDAAMVQWIELQDGTTSSARLASQLSPAYSYVRVRKCGKTVNSSVAAVRTLAAACTPPSVATVPGIVMVSPGSPVTLSLDASGDALSYQWFISDPDSVSPPALMQDGASSTFTYTPASQRSLVFARVTDTACGTFTDVAGYWTVISTPPCGSVDITQQPQDASIAAGESTPLTVVASASCPLSYQWYVADPSSGWIPLYGETSATLTVAPSETEYYRVSVAAADGTAVASHTAAVKVK